MHLVMATDTWLCAIFLNGFCLFVSLNIHAGSRCIFSNMERAPAEFVRLCTFSLLSLQNDQGISK